ncbi:MAG: NepR family anti-sigma factor [Alsobacter sp.]
MDQNLDAVPDGSGRAPGEPYGSDMQSHIGRQLRAIYDGVVAQPVPDRFLELLNELEQRSADTEADTAATGDRSEPEDKS